MAYVSRRLASAPTRAPARGAARNSRRTPSWSRVSSGRAGASHQLYGAGRRRESISMTGPPGPPMHPVVFDQPRRLTDVDSWHEHIPFAFFAVAALRPRVVVELGTWKGDSYCAFCQAVQTVGAPSRCYAIDTWEGDVHTGPYGADVLEELRAHHDPLYGSFSQLLQRTFDESVGDFADASIALLHVDGILSYDAVRHDVETWLPKLSDRGVMLLHDTNVREADFGVWRLWEELAPRFPAFAFAHGHG